MKVMRRIGAVVAAFTGLALLPFAGGEASGAATPSAVSVATPTLPRSPWRPLLTGVGIGWSA